MISTCVYIHVQPEFLERFIDATVANHHSSVKEQGNFRFDFIQSLDDPCKFMLYEAYMSQEAVDLHKSTAHYTLWRDTVKDWMAEPRLGVKYRIIEPKV